MLTKKQAIEQMQSCLEDPMWANHIELSKSRLRAWVVAVASCPSNYGHPCDRSLKDDGSCVYCKSIDPTENTNATP